MPTDGISIEEAAMKGKGPAVNWVYVAKNKRAEGKNPWFYNSFDAQTLNFLIRYPILVLNTIQLQL
jgi:hypothetical protein